MNANYYLKIFLLINVNAIKADMKMIIREPILFLFMTFPFAFFMLSKLIVVYGQSIIYDYTGINLTVYYGYILTLVISMTPSMLGTVTAFLMIDERDSKINELIFITPVSRTGYITNRLIMPFVGSMLYTIGGYYLLGIYEVGFAILLFISFLTGVQGILVSLVLYKLAADKVQGLTYSKVLSIFNVFALADLLGTRWVSLLAALTPFYWTNQLIMNFSISTLLGSLTIHALYITYLIIKEAEGTVLFASSFKITS